MSTRRVDGKVAVVTGASLGLGRAAAELLAAEGAAVALLDVHDGEGAEVVDAICRRGGQSQFWHADVTDEDRIQTVFGEVRAKWGPITVLVNNAGIAGANKATHELTQLEWDQVMNVNVKGVFLCTKHAIPQMMLAKRGSIVNLSSIYGLVSAPDVPPYHASKGAVRMMTKTDALLYASHGIRVNSIHPGFIWTPMVEGFLAGSGDVAEGRKAVDALHPLGHLGEPDDIAYGVLYLASDESKFVTGSELVIDGGYTAR
ncbi:MAG: SDR family NAD(P)-dependent oxidoreductase [Fimbriimonadaceae bacterium]